MSFAQDMLTKAQAAYENALAGQTVKYGDRLVSHHQIKELRAEVQHWQNQVALETQAAAGKNARRPIQVVL